MSHVMFPADNVLKLTLEKAVTLKEYYAKPNL